VRKLFGSYLSYVTRQKLFRNYLSYVTRLRRKVKVSHELLILSYVTRLRRKVKVIQELFKLCNKAEEKGQSYSGII
jgi:hypothetical protein